MDWLKVNPVEMNELTHIHFIAQMINTKRSLAQGYTVPTLWLTLREDLQKECINDAEVMFQTWKEEELEAKKRRDSMKYEIKEY